MTQSKDTIADQISSLIDQALALKPRADLRQTLEEAASICLQRKAGRKAELTHREIAKLKPGQRRSDPNHPGLQFECLKRKGIVVWYRYRDPISRSQRQIQLGRFKDGEKPGTAGQLTLLQARALHAKLREQRLRGNRPALPRPEEVDPRQTITVSEIIGLYISRYAKPRKKTWAEDERMLRRLVEPVIGGRPAASITHEDVQRITAPLINADKRRQAQMVRGVISKMFDVCAARSSDGAFPVAVIDPAVPNPATLSERIKYKAGRGYVATREDITAIRDGVDVLGEEVRAALMLQAYSFARVSEATAAKWEHIDLEAGTWTMPDTKNGEPHTVYLSRQAIKLLNDLGPKESGFLFAITDGGVIHGLGHSREKLGASPQLTSHALRRAGSSFVQEQGGNQDIRDRLLNHSNPTVDARYSQAEMADLRRQWSQRWADHIDGIDGVSIVSIGEARA